MHLLSIVVVALLRKIDETKPRFYAQINYIHFPPLHNA
ncbi:hypothetical protein SX4_3938 [Vibrio mimicus SX-4]|nr:hypothetical protein SX4_3938 [Vibrio mimicus SX-4]